ncbi:MAG: hypothetical protein U5P41_12370 [Gammaproteobacteria bacterium]|nr:hypothetical protein [Gammaproteobacteria bacterium]
MCKPCLTSILACWALLMAAPATADSPDFPAPPRAQVSWVSSNMVYNGRVMQVRTFNSRLPAERVLQYYRNLWQHGTKDRPGYMESDAMQPWRIISRIDKDYMMTVQVMSKGNDSTGHPAASPLDDVFQETPELGGGFPMMQAARMPSMTSRRPTWAGKGGRCLSPTNSLSTATPTITAITMTCAAGVSTWTKHPARVSSMYWHSAKAAKKSISSFPGTRTAHLWWQIRLSRTQDEHEGERKRHNYDGLTAESV